MSNENIERKIVIGLISSTEFITEVRSAYSPKFLQSAMAKRLATWCIEYFDQYRAAPKQQIETIYYEKLKNNLDKDIAEEIEQEILPSLNEEYLAEPSDIAHLIDTTKTYFLSQHLTIHQRQIEALLESGDVDGAENLATDFKSIVISKDPALNFANENALKAVVNAFKEIGKPLISYPGALGQFWNDQLIPGAFVSLMASEKRGKTYRLMEMATRAVKQKRKVAFFQAGDMTEGQQIRRFCIHLTKKSDLTKYCEEHYQPVKDCIHNQRNTCNKKIRECEFGIFEHMSEAEIRSEVTLADLIEQSKEEPDYKTCYNCKEYAENKWGVPFVQKIPKTSPLILKEAKKAFYEFYIKNKRNLILSSHPNGSLSVTSITTLLAEWKRMHNFIPDVIIIDYADLLIYPPGKLDFRQQQNEIWKQLRALSQKENKPLVITATQADANSYDTDLLTLKNFSEDKRKFAHVTAMYGLNQDRHGREKEIGIMRINEIVLREGDFNPKNFVCVLQNLRRGQPFLGSYF